MYRKNERNSSRGVKHILDIEVTFILFQNDNASKFSNHIFAVTHYLLVVEVVGAVQKGTTEH